MKSILERSWIIAVFSTFGFVGLVGFLLQSIFGLDLNLYVPLAAMMFVSGLYGLIGIYMLTVKKAEPGKEWGKNPWSNFCFAVGLFALGILLLVHNTISMSGFVVLGLFSLVFVFGFFIDESMQDQSIV
ncbi:MAG: hypothetical protein K9N46_06405 [Candidatus Marinimicrobia bacterium]|nr:hypothetical protein [Candidatus Neomarinimicrobiota bacterium]MCF7828611.1 hypothetical protein [Candidatus Neomarinimicrobiota bacterium]MCF7880352.1 hypothetical protein [Candidatus Neomarinimicrobiota bacterium]